MDVIERVRAAVVGHFGVEAAAVDAASMTFLGVEPIEILRIPGDGVTHYVTVGGSRYPMGDPADLHADPVRGPRAELMLTMRAAAGAGAGVARSLGVLAAAPAVEGVVLQTDALLDLGEPIWRDAPFTAVLLGAGEIPEIELPDPAEPVRYFAVTPVTATEAAWVRVRGAQALRDAWAEAGIDVLDPGRGAASL
ncbi:suppressor of fused domain protein [Nocardia sp. NBC_01329]|uniref:suppressor of fused domain protein n=1 Tax=Nocardia sp. NBC_01329 TaxID=2903594 RepID=UPI002E153CE2|nr:suppressor of fused domain protein [Nocardia sp. NBC_01329]